MQKKHPHRADAKKKQRSRRGLRKESEVHHSTAQKLADSCDAGVSSCLPAAHQSNHSGAAALAVAPESAQKNLPRPRTRLHRAMRRAGLDEWKLAWLLNYKIELLAESDKPSDAKLLLDYLKEAARHLDPASARNAMTENPAIEMIHGVSRPEASGEAIEN